MPNILQASTTQQREEALVLFREYLDWAAAELQRHYGIAWDVQATIEQDRDKLHLLAPPTGRLLLAYAGGSVAGVLSMRLHDDGAAELKRMYVRPEGRGRGIGRALLERAIEEARRDGRPLLRLDSAGFMHEAHALYRAAGFQTTAPYPESEIPEPLQQHWVFMQLPLR